jgi:adenylate cyclase class 2
VTYEVELKFAMPDRAAVRLTLDSLGAVAIEDRTEIDTYLRHPSRSFAETDEALRVRQSNTNMLFTYKGPKVDSTTKTRKEIELQLVPGAHAHAEILEFWRSLGFLPVRDVRKRRELLDVPWRGRTVHVSFDRVDGLGDFVELELSAESAGLEQSRQILQELAERLGLQASERRSYLELLLQKDGSGADNAANPEDWSE